MFSRAPMLGFGAVAGIIAATKWSSTDKTADWTLSADMLTATKTGATAGVSGRATVYRSNGKYYFEVKRIGSGPLRIGFANSAHSVNTVLGGSNNSTAYAATSGRIYENGTQGSTAYAALANNDILGCAVDVDARTVGWYYNGVFQTTTTNPPSGALAPAYGHSTTATGDAAVLNTGQSTFAYVPPSGFSAWG